MADSAEDAAAKRALEQARLRKERREAKIKAGGSARLNRITGLGGRPQEEAPSPAPSSSANSPAVKPVDAAAQDGVHGDPDEVDISEHFYAPRTMARTPISTSSTPPPPQGFDPNAPLNDAQLRQLMLGFDRGPNASMPPFPGDGAANNPFGMPMPGTAGGEDDPMAKLLQQMIMGQGGMGGMGGGGNPFAGMAPPPGGAPLQQQTKATSASVYIWKIVHAVFALGLGLYIALWTPFTGSKIERDSAAVAATSSVGEADAALEDSKKMFFWMFATAEALLLTTRFLVERGAKSSQGGVLGTLLQFLPPNIRGNVEVVLRYGQIFGTVRSDILVCVFVLGVCSWLRA